MLLKIDSSKKLLLGTSNARQGSLGRAARYTKWMHQNIDSAALFYSMACYDANNI